MTRRRNSTLLSEYTSFLSSSRTPASESLASCCLTVECPDSLFPDSSVQAFLIPFSNYSFLDDLQQSHAAVWLHTGTVQSWILYAQSSSLLMHLGNSKRLLNYFDSCHPGLRSGWSSWLWFQTGTAWGFEVIWQLKQLMEGFLSLPVPVYPNSHISI